MHTDSPGARSGVEQATNTTNGAKRWLLQAGLVVTLLFVTASLTAGTAAASPPDLSPSDLEGNGTAGDPYVITNASELQAMEDELDQDYHYILRNNIDASETQNWNGGDGFNPIGNGTIGDDYSFTGTFDGQGYEIRNLTIDRSNGDYQGLFAGTGNSATIKNIGLVNVDVTGNAFVGALVADSASTVKNSYANGTVSGNRVVGGLVGSIAPGGTVENSQATVTVSGSQDVGGLAGQTVGTVSESYATGDVSGNSSVGGLVGIVDYGTVEKSYATGSVGGSSDLGGLIGKIGSNGGTITSSYFDTDPDNGEGTQLATSDMQGDSLNSGFETDIINNAGFETTTGSDSDATGDGYPTLTNINRQAQLETQGLELFSGGDGTGDHPYEIANWNHLDNTRTYLSDNYVLINNLGGRKKGYGDVASSTANGGNGFSPIGGSGNEFSGSFDGNGHTISNLTINRGRSNYVGLFGKTQSATVKDVGLNTVDITGFSYTGGLIGYDNGTVTGSHVTGTVTGENYTGGLVGHSTASNGVTDSYATASVTGNVTVGGLVGSNYGTVSDSNASGSVGGFLYVGGLVGYTEGLLQNLSATGNVSADIQNSSATGSPSSPGSYVGGLVGSAYKNNARIENSSASGDIYAAGGDVGGLAGVIDDAPAVNSSATGNVNASYSDVGGLVGVAYSGAKITASNASGNVKGGGDVGGLVGTTNANITSSNASGSVVGSGQRVGGLVGEVDDASIIKSNATGSVDTDVIDTGGLVGALNSKSTVIDSHAAVDVDSTDDGAESTGGLVGSVSSQSRVVNSYATGDVTTNDRQVGGLVGSLDGTVTDSNASGSVDGKKAVGGLVGAANGENGKETITDSYSTGTVSGSDRTGGLVGVVQNGIVARSYSTGDVTATGSSGRAGGLASVVYNDEMYDLYATGNVTSDYDAGGIAAELAYDGKIKRSYATGSVNGSHDVGGIVGDRRSGSVRDSYYDRNTTGQDSSAGGTGLTTAEMTGANATASMAGIAFPAGGSDGTWHVTNSYPALSWQDTTPFYNVSIESTSSPVVGGKTLSVTANVTNLAADGGSQEIDLRDTAFDDSQRDTENLTLTTGESAEPTLNWKTSAGDAGSGSVTVASANTSDSQSVTVQTPANTDQTNGGGGSSQSSGAHIIRGGSSGPSDTQAGEEETPGSQTVEIPAGGNPTVTISGDSSNPTKKDITIVDVQANQPVNITINRASSADSSDSPVLTLDGLQITHTTGGNAAYSIEEHPNPTKAVPEGKFKTESYSISHTSGAEPSSAVLQFSVNRTKVDAANVNPENAQMLRSPTPDSEWQRLETEFSNTTEDKYVYQATTPGFSEFTVIYDEPLITMEYLHAPDTVEQGATIELNASVSNTGLVNGQTELQVRKDGELVSTSSVTVPANDTVAVRNSITFPESGTYTISLGNRNTSISVTGNSSATQAQKATDTGAGQLLAERGLGPEPLITSLIIAAVIVGLFAAIYRRRDGE